LKTLLTFQDIEALQGLYEGRTLDMKLVPPHTSKIVQLIQSGANGLEPIFRIVIGAEEDSNGRFDNARIKPLTYPLKPSGMSDTFSNFDKYRQHLISTMRSHTNDYFEGMFEIREIEIVGGVVIAIEVAQSEYRPHQNKESKKYYIRADGETRAMEDFEVSNEILKRQQRRAAALASGIVPAAHSSTAKSEPETAPRTLAPRSQRFRVGATLATKIGPGGADVEIQLVGSQSMYLRVAPDAPKQTWTSTQIVQMLRSGNSIPLPLDASFSSLDWERNDDGVALWATEPERGVARSAVQIYQNGEMRALDTAFLDVEALKRHSNVVFGYIPSVAIEEAYERALSSYLSFMAEKLDISPPLLVEASLDGVRNYRMAFSYQFAGRIISDSVSSSTRVDDSMTPARVVLLPFFRTIWDACGLSRPDNFRAG
jgi:hypothetical protein